MAWNKAVAAVATCDLMFNVGMSGMVFPAANLPIQASNRRVPIIQVNPLPSDLDLLAAVKLTGLSGEVMPALVAAAWPP